MQLFQRGEAGHFSVGRDTGLGVLNVFCGEIRWKLLIIRFLVSGFREDNKARPKDYVDPSANLVAAQLLDRLSQELAVEVEAYSGNMPRLLCAEQIASAADFEIAHGNLEARSQCGILFDRAHSFFRIARRDLVSWQHEDGVGSSVSPADSASQLVEVRQPKTICPVDHDGIGVRNINSAFDNGGREENIRFPLDKRMHDIFEVLPGHLAVANQNPGFGNQFEQTLSYDFNTLNPVVEEENLSATLQLPANAVPYDAFVVGADRSVNRDAVRRRSVDCGHVADAHQR